MPEPSPPSAFVSARPARWPWLLLSGAVLWTAVARLPLVVNAASHLDSDLAVDGLTLLEATRGQWRWHYPGTPYIGIPPVLLSWPQAMLAGVSPVTLVSGGLVASLALVVVTFLGVRQAFGTGVAVGALVPLAFASNGAIWLSGRITGGHLVAALWHAGAFGLLGLSLMRGAPRWSLILGLWCGFGLYLDSMMAVTVAGVVSAAFFHALRAGSRRQLAVWSSAFVLGLVVGMVPRWVGERLDPYSSYEEQFGLVTQPELVIEHARLLGAECLPRLLWGHKLPGLEADPMPGALNGPRLATRTGEHPTQLPAVLVTALGLAMLVGGVIALAGYVIRGPDRVGRSVAFGLLLAALATLAGFVLNRNIFNSDNYRYLVDLLVPWSLGWGLILAGFWNRGVGGRLATALLVGAWAVGMTADLHDWYARFSWVDGRGWPVRAERDDPVLDWLESNPDVRWIEGGYWDVYRLAFLTEGRIHGAPFPVYPNRFPEWQAPVEGRRILLARGSPESRVFVERALRAGGRALARLRGTTLIELP